MTDPVTVVETGAIVGALIFVDWRLSPIQRSQRRRQQARTRIEVRRALYKHAGAAGGSVPAVPVHDGRHSAKGMSP